MRKLLLLLFLPLIISCKSVEEYSTYVEYTAINITVVLPPIHYHSDSICIHNDEIIYEYVDTIEFSYQISR